MEIPYIINPRKDTGLTNSKIAIWLFLASEVMLFGGLFSGYIFLRVYADFPWPERTLPILPGLINTFILIASSITVVFAWANLKLGNWNKFRVFMVATLLCALTFLGLKVVEYKAKFAHQGMRLNDFTLLEGHLHKVKYDSHGHMAHLDKDGKVIAHHGDDQGKADSHAKADAHGDDHGAVKHSEKVMSDRIVIDAKEFSFDLTMFSAKYLEDLTEQAHKFGSKIQFADDVWAQSASFADAEKFFSKKGVDTTQFNTDEVVSALNKLLFDAETATLSIGGVEFTKEEVQGEMLTQIASAGDEVTVDTLKQAKEAFVTARGRNKAARTNENRRLWAIAKQEVKDSGKDVPHWKIGSEITLDPANFSEQLVKATSTIKAKLDKHCILLLKSSQVNKNNGLTETSVKTKDRTVITGELKDSSFEMAIDAVDFTFVVMKANEAGIDPDDAIEKTWILANSAPIKSAWEKHKKHVAEVNAGYFEDALKKTGGDEAKAKEITHHVPHNEQYRMTWKDLIRYGSDGEIDLGWASGFAGADHYNKKWSPHFHDVKFPRDAKQNVVSFQSRFTPRWNNFYAIYFTITFLHGLHIVGGGIVLGYYIFQSKMFRENPNWLANRVEIAGLFWHFVDLVWIFLFPILYLM